MIEDSITNINLNVPNGMVADVKLKPRGRTPGYWRIGNKRECLNMKLEPVDAIEVMSTLTPQEWKVLKILEKNVLKYDKINDIYYTSCHVSYDPSNMTSTQKQQWKTGSNRLIDKQLLKREKRKHYMINPAFMIPTNYELEEQQWIDT